MTEVHERCVRIIHQSQNVALESDCSFDIEIEVICAKQSFAKKFEALFLNFSSIFNEA